MIDGIPLTQALILSVPLSVAALAFYIWCALALSAVFAKSGEPRWKAWVPFVNVFEVLRLGGVAGWWVLLLVIPGVGAVVVWILTIVAAHRINLAFGYGGGMTVLAALLFPIWATVLGFGSARWIGAEGPRRRGNGVGDLAEAYGPARSDEAWPASPPPPPAPAATSPFAPPAVEQPAADEQPVAAPSAAAVPPAPQAPAPQPLAPQPPAPQPLAPQPAAAASAADQLAALWEPPVPIEESTPDAAESASVASPRRRPEPAEEPSFAPPAPAARPVETGATGMVPIGEPFDEVTGAIPNAPEPVSAAAADRSRYDDAPLFPPVGDGEHWRATAETDAFPEASGPVSAIVGSPVAGSPRRARTAVSASADDSGDFDATLLAHRNRPRWSLVTAAGEEFDLRSQIVILGRRPAPDPEHSGAQLIALDDATVSKTHARLELRGEQWHIVDLGSTNGVVAVSVAGDEIEVASGGEAPVTDRILLGDLDLRLQRTAR